MLSILIPTYNYNVYPLVLELHQQCKILNITFEILCYDDGSTEEVLKNDQINTLPNATFAKLPSNIGRSAIRNLLAKDASFDTLLFLDADVKVPRKNFISLYLENLNDDTQIIYGGILYQKERPNKEKLLRWTYGNSRESLSVTERDKRPYLRFLTLNFLIKKEVFNSVRFNEEIPNLRHEDTLFALNSKKANIHIKHIDNAIIHLGIESSQIFLKKSLESVQALKNFVDLGLIENHETALSKTANLVKRYYLKAPIVILFNLLNKRMEANILSKNPSLLLFDIYRLGYYLKSKETDA